MMSLAFVWSCCPVKPAAATLLALSYLFLNLMLEFRFFLMKRDCCRIIFGAGFVCSARPFPVGTFCNRRSYGPL